MCGIVGVINGEELWSSVKGVNEYLKQGCLAGIFRGDDSTGIMQVSKRGAINSAKAAVDGYFFLQHKAHIRMLDNTDSSVLTVLHHRAATHGAVRPENAHPFEHNIKGGSHVIGVHNGSLSTWKRNEDGLEFDVDSDWLYYRIAKLGAEKALADVSGPYALVWYDKTENAARIACNGQRPIHWAKIKDKNAVLIASEAEMLYWLASRNNIELDQIYKPDSGKVYTFNLSNTASEYTTTDVEKPTHKETTYWPSGSTSQEYGIPALSAFKLEHLEEVEFVCSYVEKSRSRYSYSGYAVHGEILTQLGEVFPAYIPYVSANCMSNMRDANLVLCKAIGVYKASDGESKVIVTVPHHMVMKTAEENGSHINWPDMESDEDFIDVETTNVPGPEGKDISESKFEELTKHGCGMCARDLTVADAPFISWMGNTDPVCAECYKYISEQTSSTSMLA